MLFLGNIALFATAVAARRALARKVLGQIQRQKEQRANPRKGRMMMRVFNGKWQNVQTTISQKTIVVTVRSKR